MNENSIMKDETKISYWDFAMTTIIVYLVPVIFIQINVFLIQSFFPKMYLSFQISDNVIIQHFLDFKFAAYLAIPLFLSLALGILKVLGIFKHYAIPLLLPLIGVYPLLPYVEKFHFESFPLWLFLLFFCLTFGLHYYVLRILFANFHKIKKIAYVSMVILILLFLFALILDTYEYDIRKLGYYSYNIDNLDLVIGMITQCIFLTIFAVLFVILISAYVYWLKNRHNIQAIKPKGL